MMLGVVFSRDRAMQLDATLRSFSVHCRDHREVRLFVIYKATRDLIREQYVRLAQEDRDVNFMEEEDFRSDFLGLLSAQLIGRPIGLFRRALIRRGAWVGRVNNLGVTFDRLRHLLFLVDDSIFVRDFSLHEVCEVLDGHPEALGFTFHLGRNVTSCYSHSKPQSLPRFTQLEGRVLEFDWSSAEDDFGYPMQLSGAVYRTSDLVPLLNTLPFENPNRLEAQMAARAHLFRRKEPCLLCYEQSVAFCNPINRVQTIYPNRVASTSDYSIERLAGMFEDGYRFKIEAYNGFVADGTAATQEIPPILQHPPNHRR
jgi:hypothetical protein